MTLSLSADLGCIVGCFIGGWVADRWGRINGVLSASLFAMVGGALQAAAQSSDFMLVARVVTGLGTGALTAYVLLLFHRSPFPFLWFRGVPFPFPSSHYLPASRYLVENTELTACVPRSIVPVYCSEVSGASHRGAFLGYVFIANYLGISVAYWLSFGVRLVLSMREEAALMPSFSQLGFIDEGLSPIRWRFLLAFQCLPAIILVCGIKLLPDSPRYLASVGRHEEAREVLEHIRGGASASTDAELAQMRDEATHNKGSGVGEFVKILAGRANTELHKHLGRRAWLSIWLQMMASWVCSFFLYSASS